jgi:hypothetical protein
MALIGLAGASLGGLRAAGILDWGAAQAAGAPANPTRP